MHRWGILICCLFVGCATRPVEGPVCPHGGSRQALAGVVGITAHADRPQIRDAGVYTRLKVPLESGVEAVCRAGLTLGVPVYDPASDGRTTRQVKVARASIDNGQLSVRAAGPVTAGSRLVFRAGALHVHGGYTAAGSIGVTAPLKPMAGALWFKAYVPQNTALLPKALYYRRAPNPRYSGSARMQVARPRFAGVQALTAALRAQYAPFIRSGRLSSKRAAHYLSLVSDPRTRAVFTGPDGVFQPLLMAAVLANAGTIGEPAIGAIIGGHNVTGRPARMVFDPHVSGHLARSGVIDNRWIIRVNPDEALGEPFALLAPVLGTHEACHEDNRAGQDEEVIASYAGYLAAAQQYLAQPSLARSGTRLSRIINSRILAMLNSGRDNFPAPGLLAAPHRQPIAEVLPGSLHAGRRPSLDALLRELYRRTPDVDTPGNPYVDGLLGEILGTRVTGVRFTRATIARLDAHSTVIDHARQRRLMKILDLAPAPNRSLTGDACFDTTTKRARVTISISARSRCHTLSHRQLVCWWTSGQTWINGGLNEHQYRDPFRRFAQRRDTAGAISLRR